MDSAVGLELCCWRLVVDVSGAVAGNPLLGHPKIGAPVGDQPVGLLERSLVEQQVDALAGAQLAFAMLPFAPFLAAALGSQPVATLQLIQQMLFHVRGMIAAEARSVGGAGHTQPDLAKISPTGATIRQFCDFSAYNFLKFL